jgi:hypothetical protein
MKQAMTLDVSAMLNALSGKIGPAKCICYRGWDAMWTVTKDGATCSHCGEVRRLGAAPKDVQLLPCPSCDTSETTWFVSASGARICSCCGEKR